MRPERVAVWLRAGDQPERRLESPHCSESSLYGLKWASGVLTAIDKTTMHSQRILKCIAKRNFSRAFNGILIGFPESYSEDTDVYCEFMHEWLNILACILSKSAAHESECRPLVTESTCIYSCSPIFKIQQLAVIMLKQSVKNELFYIFVYSSFSLA